MNIMMTVVMPNVVVGSMVTIRVMMIAVRSMMPMVTVRITEVKRKMVVIEEVVAV